MLVLQIYHIVTGFSMPQRYYFEVSLLTLAVKWCIIFTGKTRCFAERGNITMKKKILSAALALCLAFGSAAALPKDVFTQISGVSVSAVDTATSGKCGDKITWSLKNGVLTISGSGNMYNYATFTNGHSPFYNRQDITSVVIEQGVVKIGDCAFYGCSKLTGVTIPTSVMNIGRFAFAKCEKIQKLSLHAAMKTIGPGAFSDCTELSSVGIPPTVSMIEYDTFRNCKALKSIYIHKNVTIISTSAFDGCSSLEMIKVNGDNKYFTGINGDGVVYTKDKATLFLCPQGKTSVTIPSSIRNIGEYAFHGCDKIKSITIPEGVFSVSNQAFSGCNGLTAVNIPKSAGFVSSLAFSGCKNLKSITVDKNNKYYSAVDGVVYNKDKTMLLIVPNAKAALNIPATVTEIGSYSVSYNSAMTSLTIPSGVKTIYDNAFYYSTKLKTITVPDSVTSIGRSAFYYCASLESFKVPAKVTQLPESLFFGCNALKNVTLHNNIRSIADYCFAGCPALASLYIPEGVTTLGQYILDSSGIRNLTVPSTVKTIGKNSFAICLHLKNVYISRGVKNIGEGAFRSCLELEDVVIPDTVVSIGDNAFALSKVLRTVFVPSSVKTISASAFGSGASRPKDSAFRICSVQGSAAEKFAKDNKFAFTPVIKTTRLAGEGRYSTAVQISKNTYSTASTVVLAYGLNYADALAGVPLAKKYKAPILLTDSRSLEPATLDEIRRLGATNVVLLGGEGVIGKEITDQLKKAGIAENKIVRISGKTRFSTAAAIAEKLNTAPSEVFFVYGFGYADALSVSPVAALKGAPVIYLNKSGEMDADTKAYLEKLKKKGCVKNAYVIGGEGVIDKQMMNNAAKTLGLSKATRVSGTDRYATCTAVNNTFKSVFKQGTVCIATGTDYPDALAGGVFAAKYYSPLMLINGKSAKPELSSGQKKFIKSCKATKLAAFGGAGAVSPDHIVYVSDNTK